MSKVKEIKRMCGGVIYYAAQARAQIDAEIGKKDHLWMETNHHDRLSVGTNRGVNNDE